MPTSDPTAADFFTERRPRLTRIAYRMLGSMAEAEDVVQDAWLRWHAANHDEIEEPEGYLVRIVTRLCLDVLKSARVQREQYIGPWLPEPLIDPPDGEREDLTLSLMLALERLSPLERAAFLLHDVFELEFDEVGTAIGRDAAACRQLASRARTHLQSARPRFPVSRERGIELAAAFHKASSQGDLEALKGLLTADVGYYADGGGKRPAALNPIHGQDKVARLLAGLSAKFAHHGGGGFRPVMVDGLPGYTTVEPDGMVQLTVIDIDGDLVRAIYVVRNPDKLGRIQP